MTGERSGGMWVCLRDGILLIYYCSDERFAEDF